jgi:transglutaminase-like putative cysteine protease
MMMNLLKLKNKIYILFVILNFNGFSQSFEEINLLKEKYKGYSIVNSLHSEYIKIDLENGIPVVRSTPKDEFILFSQSVVPSMSQDEISFTSFDSIEKISAYSIIPNGSKFKKVKASNFTTKSISNEGSVFHDDQRVTSFMFPELTENSYRFLEYTELSLENRFPFGFYFSSYIPIHNSTFVIDCDSSIHVFTKMFNLNSDEVSFKEELVKKRRILTWTMNSPKILKRDERSTNSRYYAPHILAQISYYFKEGKRINILSSTDDLHKWYQNHLKSVINEVPDDEMKAIADSLVVGINEEVEKVKSIYYWVQNNIKYIAFEDGESGFVPRPANTILKKRYGDCKDMSTLIYSMLKYLNIPIYLTWVGTREIPYKYTEFPSTACDNHMIATYFEKGQPNFLDATNSFLPYGYPSFGIQGKEAFIHISNDEYKIVDVPILEKNLTSWRDTSFVKIENEKLIGKNHSSTSGYYNFYINDVYKNVEKTKLIEIVEGMHQKGNNTFKVLDAEVFNVGDRTNNLAVKFDFEVYNYVSKYDDEVYVNLILDKDITYGEFKKDRMVPFELASKSNDIYTVILDIPQGYSVKSLPKNAKFSSGFVDFNLEYVQKGNKVYCDVKLNLKFLYLYPESFEAWNEFIKIQKSAFLETVVLKKN